MPKPKQSPHEKQKIRLIAPSPEMRLQAEDFIAEFQRNGEEYIPGSRGVTRFAGFAEWLSAMKEMSDGWLPSSTFFAVTLPSSRFAGKIIGVADIRHYLTDEAYRYGHIGYSVRPSERSKGYGTEILRLALQKAYELGILEAVVTCKKDNHASRKVMRRNGMSKKEETAGENGEILLIYTKELQ